MAAPTLLPGALKFGQPPFTPLSSITQVFNAAISSRCATGVTFNDLFAGLQKPSTQRTVWRERQREFSESWMNASGCRDLQQALYAEMMALYKEAGSISAPVNAGKLLFFWRRTVGEAEPELYVAEGREGIPQAQKLFSLSEVKIGDFMLSPTGDYLVCNLPVGGSDLAEVGIYDVKAHAWLEKVGGNRYSRIGAWDTHSPEPAFFYISQELNTTGAPAKKGGQRLFRHVVGAQESQDEHVFGFNGEITPDDEIYPHTDQGGNYLLIDIYVPAANPYDRLFLRTYNASDPTAFVEIMTADQNTQSGEALAFDPDTIYLHNNAFKDGDFGISAFAIADAAKGPSAWKKIVAPGTSPIQNFFLVNEKLYVLRFKGTGYMLAEHTLDGVLTRELPVAPGCAVTSAQGWPDLSSVAYTVEGPLVPRELRVFDTCSGSTDLIEKVDLGISLDDLMAETAEIPSTEGFTVSVVILGLKDAPKDGTGTLKLETYSGFNAITSLFFDRTFIPALRRGIRYAFAWCRGGGDKGVANFHAGARANIGNTIADLEAVADWLVKNGYARPGGLAATGWSHGGFLASIIANKRPDLFGAAHLGKPYVGPALAELDNVGRKNYWMWNYGDVSEPAMVYTLATIGPYYGILSPKLCPMMVTEAENDDRVGGDPCRITAYLQSCSSNGAILFTELGQGHQNPSSSETWSRMMSRVWAFVITTLGQQTQQQQQ